MAMSATVAMPTIGDPVRRSRGDLRMRWLLRLPADAPATSVLGARAAFRRSILVSAVRCVITYLLVPLSGPLLGFANGIGPLVGLLLGSVSFVAVVLATRRFFAADHRARWKYAALASGIVVLLVVQAAMDVVDLVG